MSRFAAGSGVLGRPCHELVHGSRAACDTEVEDCPLRRCLSARRSSTAHHHHDGEAELEEVTCIPLAGSRGASVERVLYVTRPLLVPGRVVPGETEGLALLEQVAGAAAEECALPIDGPADSSRLEPYIRSAAECVRREDARPRPARARTPFALDDDVVVSLDEVARRYLHWAVLHFPGDRSQLARALGLSERTLYRRLQDRRRRE